MNEPLNRRLRDLVRYMRSELFAERLITKEEYADLLNDEGAPKRLEDYDAEVRRLTADLAAQAALVERSQLWLRRLLNKVNVVTATHRHGNRVERGMLDDLSDRQIDVEEGIAGIARADAIERETGGGK